MWPQLGWPPRAATTADGAPTGIRIRPEEVLVHNLLQHNTLGLHGESLCNPFRQAKARVGLRAAPSIGVGDFFGKTLEPSSPQALADVFDARLLVLAQREASFQLHGLHVGEETTSLGYLQRSRRGSCKHLLEEKLPETASNAQRRRRRFSEEVFGGWSA